MTWSAEPDPLPFSGSPGLWAGTCHGANEFAGGSSRIATRRGPLKAVVAVEQAMLVAIWPVLTDQTPYRDPGANYHACLNGQDRNRAEVPIRYYLPP